MSNNLYRLTPHILLYLIHIESGTVCTRSDVDRSVSEKIELASRFETLTRKMC